MGGGKLINPAGIRVGILFVALTAAAGWWFTGYMVRYGDSHERRDLITMAVTAAASVDPADLAPLLGGESDTATQQWLSIREDLHRVRASIPEARFVYLMKRKADKVVFLADAEPPDSKDYSPPGQPYDEATPALLALFEDAPPYVEGPMQDKWGAWVSGLAPIRDPATGHVLAVMGIDIDASRWSEIVRGYRVIGLSISGLSALGALLFLAMLYQQRRGSAEIEALNAKLTAELAERRRTNESLLLLEKAVRTTKVGIVFRDVDNIVRFINPADAEMHGYKAEDIIGRDVSVLGAPGARKKLTKEQLKDIKTWARERVNVRRDGSMFPVHLISDVVLNEEGEPLGIVTTCEDITGRKQVEVELKEAKENAEAASRAKSEFMANMSHELRTPLNGIIGLTELLLGRGLPQTEREYMQMVAESAKMLLRIINDILDFSKIEAGKLELSTEPFSLTRVLRSVIEPLGVVARKKGLAVNLRVDDNVPPYLVGDGGRLRQTLFNLLGNAIKFTEAGVCAIQVSMLGDSPEGPDKASLLFSVTDTGIGIPPEKQDLIFGKFTQADQSVSRRFGGTGLGLAISQNIVLLMGGRIWVRSEPGKGSTFYFTAIFDIAKEPPVEEPLPQVEPPVCNLQGPALRVLLAEDNRINQVVACSFLERDCHSVRIAQNGAEALEALGSEPFDIVLMDVEMPVMDGIEATHHIRENRDGRFNAAIPIVALTAHALSGYREKLLGAGMDQYVSKPIVLEDLREAITKAMAGRMTLGELGAGAVVRTPKGDKVLDLEGMRRRLGDDGPLIELTLGLFEGEAPLRFSALDEALKKRSASEGRVAAHSFKNLSLNVGADRLSALLLDIENLCADSDAEGASEMFSRVSAELAAVSAELERHKGSRTPLA